MKSAVLYALFLSSLTAAHACGGRISLRVAAQTNFRAGRVEITADIENRGNECAHDVRLVASLADAVATSAGNQQIEAGETLKLKATLDAPRIPGVHTIPIRCHYVDGNGHAFTALTVAPVITGMPTIGPQPLSAAVGAVTLSKRCQLRVNVTNNTAVTLQLSAHLIVPDEIACGNAEQAVTLGAGASGELEFGLSNASALTDSRYPVFVIFDYLEDGLHRSTFARGVVSTVNLKHAPGTLHRIGLWTLLALIAVYLTAQFRPTKRLACLTLIGRHVPAVILLAITVFTLYHLHARYLFMDTMTVGGDTPAHNYLASHLKASLLGQGRIVSWASGWWCGFPMFQFYFSLPYLLMALLDAVLPFNIAFKLVSVLGMLALPWAAYGCGRILGLRRPAPTLLAVAMLLMLFDRSHTMWGVNAYSTLAGMISNSLSFPLMLLAIACAVRDADEGTFRIRTVLLITALIASHFFTSVIAALVLLAVPLTQPRAGAKKALLVVGAEGSLAVLLMAWWLIPLAAKSEWTVAFGTNWDVDLLKQFPMQVRWLLPLSLVGLVHGLVRKRRFAVPFATMLVGALLLFFFGYGISGVFVNVRLWPFILFATLAFAACGAAVLVRLLKAQGLAVAGLLVAAMLFGPGRPNDVRAWAKWNYEGLESKTRWPVFRDLVLPLANTPGRLANDLHEDNDLLGSSRIFETVPHLTGKPILEGGILSGAPTSLFSYYVQGEMSKACAGFPTIVQPTTFNIANGTRHLELLNVKHFIARSKRTQRAMQDSADWKLLGESLDWKLFELTTHDGSYVFVPRNEPVSLRTEHWQEAGLEWIYRINALTRPLALLAPDEPNLPDAESSLSNGDLLAYLDALPGEDGPMRLEPSPVTSESVSDTEIRFHTTAVGKPHILKMSYYPNWKVDGAERIYRVAPFFMLVYPQQEEVVLTYGRTASDRWGLALSWTGLLVLLALATVRARRRLNRHDGSQRLGAGGDAS